MDLAELLVPAYPASSYWRLNRETRETRETRNAEWVRLRLDGVHCREIAHHAGYHITQIYLITNRSGFRFPRAPGSGRPRGSIFTARAAEIIRLRTDGRGLQEIGQQFGISRERVRQIVEKHGGIEAAAAGKKLAAEGRHAATVERRPKTICGFCNKTFQNYRTRKYCSMKCSNYAKRRNDALAERAWTLRQAGATWAACAQAIGWGDKSQPGARVCRIVNLWRGRADHA